MSHTLEFPLQLQRQYAGPLDRDSVFQTTLERMSYLSNNRRYAGQPVVDLEQGQLYILNTTKDGYIAVGMSSEKPDKEFLTYAAMVGQDTSLLQDGHKMFVWDASGDPFNKVTSWAYYRYNKEDDKFTLLSKGDVTIDLSNYYTKSEVDSKILTSSGSGTFKPVADIAALKAMDTTSSSSFPDQWAIYVASKNTFYTLHRTSQGTDDGDYTIAPTTGFGRWVKLKDFQIGTWSAKPYLKGWVAISLDGKKFWQAKQDFSSGTEPTANSAYWQLIHDSGYTDAEINAVMETKLQDYLPLNNTVDKTVEMNGKNLRLNGPLGLHTDPAYGIHQLGGRARVQALANPTAPTVVQMGTKGTPAAAEQASLQITAAPTADGNITVTLDGVGTNIAVDNGVAEVATLDLAGTVTTAGSVNISLNGAVASVAVSLNDTAAMVADKIKATVFTGWTLSGVSPQIIFTSNATGVKADTSYSVGTSAGVTGTVTTNTQGVNADTPVQIADRIRATAFTGWTTGGTAGTDTVTFTSNTTGSKADATFSAGTTGATGTITTTVQGKADTRATRTYQIVAEDFKGGLTLISNGTTITDSNNALSSTDFVQVDWTAIQGARHYHVYRNGTEWKLATVAVNSFKDDGSLLADNAPAPVRNNTADVIIDGTLYVGAIDVTTDGIREGSANLYHTSARVRGTLLTGYAKALANASLAPSDTLLKALGLLEYKFEVLNATFITTGTLNDARLSSNVALRNAANDFTATQVIDLATSVDALVFKLANAFKFVIKSDGHLRWLGGDGVWRNLFLNTANDLEASTTLRSTVKVATPRVDVSGEHFVYDNRDNSILQQSASTVTSNRFFRFLNATYNRAWINLASNGTVQIGGTEPTTSSGYQLDVTLNAIIRDALDVITATGTKVAQRTWNTVSNATADLHQWGVGAAFTTALARITATGIMDAMGFRKNGSIKFVDLPNINDAHLQRVDDIPPTELTKLSTDTNWDASGTYTGTPLVNCNMGTSKTVTILGVKYRVVIEEDNVPFRTKQG